MAVLESRTIISFAGWFLFAIVIYCFLPNKKISVWKQLPGAIFTSVLFMMISFGFSVYLTIFHSFEGLYGSMTAIILVMLWLYFCMYTILLGGLINSMLLEKEISVKGTPVKEPEKETGKKS